MIKSFLNQSTTRSLTTSSRILQRAAPAAKQEVSKDELQDMYNNEKQSVGDELDHPENEHPDVIPTTTSTKENNTEFDE